MEKQMCVLCEDENVGEFTCNECQQTFCWKHLPEHRSAIHEEINHLIDQCQHLKSHSNHSSHQTKLLQQIDQWEKDSIEKISKEANLARTELQALIEQSKLFYQQSFEQISKDIEQSKLENNYSEMNIIQWTKQLNNIQKQFENTFFIEIYNQSQQNLIQFNQNQSERYEQSLQSSATQRQNHFSFNDDQFDQVFGHARLFQENLLASNQTFFRSIIQGKNCYSSGKQFFHLKIEQVNKHGSSCFLGIINENETLKEPFQDIRSIYGVWSSGYNVICGHRSDTDRIRRWKEKDILTFIFDCDQRQICIQNKRINWSQLFFINLDLCPFPWKFLTIIKGYKLRIINNS